MLLSHLSISEIDHIGIVCEWVSVGKFGGHQRKSGNKYQGICYKSGEGETMGDFTMRWCMFWYVNKW